jgi:hypothetical protein
MAIAAMLLFFQRKALATFMVGRRTREDIGAVSGAPKFSSSDVVDLVCQLAVYASLFQVFDALLGVSGGVLRGCGRQRRVAVVNFLTLWVVGVAGGMSWTFLCHAGIFGLWYGLASGVASGGLATGYMVLKLDWSDEAARAATSAALSEQHFRGSGTAGLV